jgi:tRNA pseudouridine38-40 synthase
VKKSLDIVQMNRAARSIEGQHDFRSFRAHDCTATTTVRTVLTSQVVRVNERDIHYIVVGKGFLKQMVRILAGTLVDVGLGRLSVEDFRRVLDARDRTKAGMTAPAYGLMLEWVRYGADPF